MILMVLSSTSSQPALHGLHEVFCDELYPQAFSAARLRIQFVEDIRVGLSPHERDLEFLG